VERMRKLLASPVIIMPSRLVLSTVVNFMKDYDEWKGIIEKSDINDATGFRSMKIGTKLCLSLKEYCTVR
jgi:hypothetical protein